MTRFLYGEILWQTIASHVKKAKRTKAAIAFVTKPALLAFKAGDVLIVDATDAAIASGRTSASALAALKRKAVSLYSHTGLHAKVVIAGSVLFSSSANLSDSSETRLLEAGLQTDDPNALSGAVGLIEKLIETSTVIDLPYLARIRKIKVERSFNGSKSRARGMEGYRDPATWLVGVHSIYEPKNADELERIERGEKKAEAFLASPRSSVSWIRCGLKKRMRDARRGDNLVMLSREDVNSDVEQVFRHTAVLMIEHEPNCLRIYYEDPSNPERAALSWSQFKGLAKLVGLRQPISKNTVRLLTDKQSADLKDYWEKARKR